MKTFRRGIIAAGLLLSAFCILLLMNITAPNPTGRRYSSSVVPESDGRAAEDVLQADLNITHNERSPITMCICDHDGHKVNKCQTCLISSSCVINTSIPDFISKNFLIDSKNYAKSQLRLDQQLRNFVCAARENNLQLWLYVRKDTDVQSSLIQAVQSTGGDVVYYFTKSDYIDQTDGSARLGLVGAVAFVGLGGYLEVLALRRRIKRPVRIRIAIQSPPPPSPGSPKSSRPVVDPTRKADDAVSFAQRMKDKTRRDMDEDDSYR